MKIWNSETQKKVLQVCANMLDGWVSPIHPGCARSVAEVYYRAGLWTYQNLALTYDESPATETLCKHSVQVFNPIPGAMIFFDKTYDAVAPGGIGPEDTYTHVGIIKGKISEGWEFYHYGSSGWSISTTPYWIVNGDYRIPEGYALSGEGGYDTLKVFIHPDADGGNLVANIVDSKGVKLQGYISMEIKLPREGVK